MKTTKALFTFFIFLSTTVNVFPQSYTEVTVGGHYWYAAPDYKGEAFKRIKVGSGNMVGPYLSLRKGRFTLSTSILMGTFKWDYTVYNFNLNIKRNDLNFMAGYSLSPRFTIFGAIKNLSLKGNRDLNKFESKKRLYGGGVSSILPFLHSSFFLYGSAAYLYGTEKTTEFISVEKENVYTYNEHSNTGIAALTFGLGFRASSGLTITGGYKVDLSNKIEKRIQGIMATATYAIR